jgi:hypothetical protein
MSLYHISICLVLRLKIIVSICVKVLVGAYRLITTKKLTKASNIINCSRINLATIAHYHEETDGITHHATVPLRSGEEQFGLYSM